MKSTESRIDLILGLSDTKRRYGYDHVKFFFPAAEAKSGAPLSPIISMFQLNITQVCKDLNTQSSKSYLPGVILSAKIFKLSGSGKTSVYTIRLSSPSFKYYLNMALLSLIDFKNFGISDEMLKPYQTSTELSGTPVVDVKLSSKEPTTSNNNIIGDDDSFSPPSDDNILVPMPTKIPLTLLYDILVIHSYNKSISSKEMAGSIFGSLRSMVKIKTIQLDCLNFFTKTLFY